MRVLTLVLCLCLSSCGPVLASEVVPDWGRLADCIHRIENGTWPPAPGKGEQYGIHSVKIAHNSPIEARRVCLVTLRHKYQQWVSNGKKVAYLTYLSKRYCPVNAVNWERMLRYYYKEGINNE